MRNMDVADLLSEDGEAKSVKDIEKALLDAEEVPVRDEPKRGSGVQGSKRESADHPRRTPRQDGPQRRRERPCASVAAAPP